MDLLFVLTWSGLLAELVGVAGIVLLYPLMSRTTAVLLSIMQVAAVSWYVTTLRLGTDHDAGEIWAWAHVVILPMVHATGVMLVTVTEVVRHWKDLPWRRSTAKP